MLLFISLPTGCITHKYTVTDPPVPFQYAISEKAKDLAEIGAEFLEKKYNVYTANLELQADIEDIANNIITVCELPDLNWRFYILDTEEKNAFSLGDGRICITLGIIDLFQNEEHVAGVLAHEIGHTCARHIIRLYDYDKKVRGYVDGIGILLTGIDYGSSTGTAYDIIRIGKTLANIGFIFGYSRKTELHADQIAMRYLKRAAYDPAIYVDVLTKFKEVSKTSDGLTFFSTHPSDENRIQNAQKFLEYVTTHEKTLVE